MTRESPATPHARGVANLTVHIPSAFRENATSSAKKKKPRWNTPEFKFYYLVALFAIPAMVWIPISLSRPSHPNYNAYAPRLSDGWLFGWEVDDSDAQYRSFRSNFGTLCKAAAGYLTIRFIYSRVFGRSSDSNLPQIPINVILSLATVVALHGSSALKILLIMTVNLFITKLCRGSMVGVIWTWVFNAGALFSNEYFQGYRFGALSPGLAFLDGYTGIYPRWNVIFNITMLRLISFNMDHYWAWRMTESVDDDTLKLTDKQRVSAPHKPEIYSLTNYIAYILYPPLYIAGPIISFNDFMWQHRRPLKTSPREILMYLLRFAFCILTMEFILHSMYVVAIKDTRAWLGDSPAEIAMIGFWNLIIVWLKLLIPWRFFRAWALLDGIDPPENMVRCMVNNYSTLGFWRSWHRSYNLWIIRYIYVPLGGTKYLFFNLTLVFTFVALWHDLTFRLLAWGWLISLFVLPEILAASALPAKKYGSYPWYRHVCAIGGILNMFMMVAANLVGFVVGVEGAQYLFGQLFGTAEGLRFMFFALAIMFVGVQFMFEYRDEEFRQGIYRRC